MKKILFLFVFVIFCLIGTKSVSAANCSVTPNVGTNTSHECVDMSGYAWGADNNPFGGVGWIKFSGSLYKVEFDRNDLTLHGYAWSENYGYIRFGGFTENGDNFPLASACENNSEADNECNAHLIRNNNGGYDLVGYARFCFVYQSGCSGSLKSNSELGGYDGWIGFKGSSFNINYSTSNNNFSGYAWGGGSSNEQTSEYGKGAGWIKMNPTGGGVKCDVAVGKDCINDNIKPIVVLEANNTQNNLKVDYGTQITLDWTITGPSTDCDTYTAYSTPTNSNWPSGVTFSGLTGSWGPFTIDTATTFSLVCTNGSETGNDDVFVELNTYTPVVTLTAPATVNYGDPVDVNWTATNIPFGCQNGATIYNSQAQPIANVFITPDGNPATVFSGTERVSLSLIQSDQWQFECKDNTSPTPERIGRSLIKKTTVYIPPVVMTLNVKDKGTNSTSFIPCTNTGVEITYNVVSGKHPTLPCLATINMSDTDNDWGKNTSFVYGSSQTVSTGAVTATDPIYRLQCPDISGAYSTTAKALTHTCASGTLSVISTPGKSCYTPSDPQIDIYYSGSNLQANSCTKSTNWIDSGWTGNQSNFSGISSFSPSQLGIGTHNFTMSNCIESNYPTNPPLSSTAVVEIKTSCPVACTDDCDPTCTAIYKGKFRCSNPFNVKFKEQ